MLHVKCEPWGDLKLPSNEDLKPVRKQNVYVNPTVVYYCSLRSIYVIYWLICLIFPRKISILIGPWRVLFVILPWKTKASNDFLLVIYSCFSSQWVHLSIDVGVMFIFWMKKKLAAGFWLNVTLLMVRYLRVF